MCSERFGTIPKDSERVFVWIFSRPVVQELVKMLQQGQREQKPHNKFFSETKQDTTQCNAEKCNINNIEWDRNVFWIGRVLRISSYGMLKGQAVDTSHADVSLVSLVSQWGLMMKWFAQLKKMLSRLLKSVPPWSSSVRSKMIRFLSNTMRLRGLRFNVDQKRRSEKIRQTTVQCSCAANYIYFNSWKDICTWTCNQFVTWHWRNLQEAAKYFGHPRL